MALSYCAHCGHPLSNAAAACPDCGRPAETPPARIPPAQTQPAVPPAAPAPLRQPGDWGIRPVLVGLLALLPPVLLIALLAETPIPLSLLTAISAVLLGMVQVALVWILALRSRRPSFQLIGLAASRRPLPITVIATLAAIAGSIGFSWLYATTVTLFGWDLLLPEPPPAGIILPGALVVFSFIALAVWTPLAEEIFFRGFVMSGLVNRWGFPVGLIAAAAVFAALHFSIENLLPIFVIGLLLGGLYRYTGSIWPGVFFHIAQNALALTTVLAQPGN